MSESDKHSALLLTVPPTMLARDTGGFAMNTSATYLPSYFSYQATSNTGTYRHTYLYHNNGVVTVSMFPFDAIQLYISSYIESFRNSIVHNVISEITIKITSGLNIFNFRERTINLLQVGFSL